MFDTWRKEDWIKLIIIIVVIVMFITYIHLKNKNNPYMSKPVTGEIVTQGMWNDSLNLSDQYSENAHYDTTY